MRWFLLVLLFCSTLQAEANRSLIIVTSNHIKENSKKLEEFIQEKEKRGFKVLLATEDQFGGEDVKGPQKVLLIRNWLKTVYLDYSFLLIIGDSHPKYGETPIAQGVPRGADSPDICAQFGLICNVVETDNFYSDLDGSCDLNENGTFGEYEVDYEENGIDYDPELIVGRIPVYYDNIDDLDRMLDNIINYMNETQEGISYRFKTMFAATFVWFKGYNNLGTVRNENKDTAEVSEWIIHNVLNKYEDTSYTRLYEGEGVVHSDYEYDRPLTKENLIDEWSNNYGMIFWFGHGQPKGVARTVWVEDTNNNELGENSEVQSISFLESVDGETFNVEKPAFVAAESCEVGSIEIPGNITSMLLLNNAAIGMISASNVSDDSNTDWSSVDNEIDETSYGIDAMASFLIEGLLEGDAGGAVFARKRYELAIDSKEPRTHENKLMINYFGDPTLSLYDSVKDIIEKEDTDTEASDSETVDNEVSDEDTTTEDNNENTGCSITLF